MNSILERRAVAIARSFRELANYSPTKEIIKYLIEQGRIDTSKPAQDAKNAIIEYFLTDGMKYNIHIPFFSRNAVTLALNQEKLFDSFVLSNTIAGFLRGIDQYPAGLCMHEHGFEQFALFCHYTSIYQLVNSFLSLHGTCFVAKPVSGQTVEKVTGPWIEKQKRHVSKTSFAFLKENCLLCSYDSGKWTLNPCSFSHEERWKRFAEVLKRYISNGWAEQIPEGVSRYYGFLKVMEAYKEPCWEERTIDYLIAFSSLDEFKEILNKSWKIIPKVRNEAIYKNIRYDMAERVWMDNKGSFPQELVEGRLETLKQFNEAMIEWVCLDLRETLFRVREIMKNDSLYFRCLEDATANPIIALTDPDLKRILESLELDRINKNIKELIPLILPYNFKSKP